MSEATGHGDHHDNGMGHAVPWPILVGVFVSLLGLTFLTVAVTYVDLGPLNIVIALGVATVKAAMVVLFFMHLFWDKPLNSIVFVLTIAFVGVFLAFTIIDTKQYQPAIAQLNTDKATASAVAEPTQTTTAAGGPWTPPNLEDEQKQLVEKIKGIASGGTGDAAAGKAMFTQFCAVCHKLEGEGKEIGPDLADFDRQNLDRVIISVAVPSAEIRKGYDNYNIKLNDGPVVLGVKADIMPDGSFTLKMSDGTSKKLTKADVKSEKLLKVSLMPEGLFDGKSDDEVRNLLEYLKSVPITAPAPSTPVNAK